MPPHVESELKLGEEPPQFKKLVAPSADSWKFKLCLPELALVTIYLAAGIYGGYVCFTSAKFATQIFTFVTMTLAMLGAGAGAHRLWSHRAYKCKPQLEIFIAMIFLMSGQRSIITWAKRHRQHHQYSDTDGDPHNATRGLFFSHIGWMMVEPHPEVTKREKYVDVSDLMNNKIVKFQQDYFFPLMLLCGHIIPIYIPALWGESVYVSFLSNVFRMHLCLQLISCVNSVAHLIGYKPIDRTAVGTQTQFLASITVGEGFHNYHHTFPYDYRSSEFGDIKYNLSALFIEFMAKIGWAYDLKVTSEEVIKNRVLKKGDGTDLYYIPNNEAALILLSGLFILSFVPAIISANL